MQAPDVLARTWAGHPRGLYLVAFTETWERFSYWGLAGIFVLFLTADADSGGWGWDSAEALRLYGWYGGLAFLIPVLGAWLANNRLGERRCILWGAITIALGHVCLAGIDLGPRIVGWFGTVDVVAALRDAGVKPGQLFPGELLAMDLQQWLDANPTSGATLPLLWAAYLIKSWAFACGLMLIVAGTGLLKPAISSIVARLYPEGGARRDEGFAYFFVGIYLGALGGALATGFFGERFGWHYGLTIAGFGMAVGLLGYLAKQRAWLADIGRMPTRVLTPHTQPLTSQERQRLTVIVVQGCFTVVYAAAFYQMFGLLNLYAHDQLDRHVGDFEVPTTWMQTINLWSFFVFVPLSAKLWRRLARTGRNPSASYKLAAGLAALAIGYAVIGTGDRVDGAGKTGLLWLMATYVLFGLGDALVWASQLSLTSKLAPARYSVLLMGSWYLCIGLGTWLTGYIGAFAQPYENADVFYTLAASCALASLLLVFLTPALIRRMHGGEQQNAVC